MQAASFTRLASALGLSALLISGMAACHKDKNTTESATSEEKAIAGEQSLADRTFNDVDNITDMAISNNLTMKTSEEAGVASPCATVTRDTTVTPHLLTVDFGPTNCLCNDGRYRRGKIKVAYDGLYMAPGHSRSISFDQYFVNDNQVTGTKTITNGGQNNNGQTYFTVVVNGSVILANNAGTISWNSNRTRTWVSGENTPAWSDNVFEITGSGTYTRANGNVFAVNISTPLVAAVNCNWIKSGVVSITRQSNGNIRTLDYGNGTCDALAQLTVNGNTYNITLH